MDHLEELANGGLQAGLSGVKQSNIKIKIYSGHGQMWELACLRWHQLGVPENRGVCIAGKPAPTEKQSCIRCRQRWLYGPKSPRAHACRAFLDERPVGPLMRVITVLEAYRKHIEERAALGIVSQPLNAEQTAGLVELLKNPPAGEEEFLVDLITNRIPPGG
ncbi:aconitate hydratase B [Ditylenchus destructor]|uniref:Aconitate hydratase B n=1 Tax=Ditylenchus destructor TaxID=166010 RepID=A0AAD4MEM3_9BILA|nr:aconitate hydratase B [Ditylenchus destructor]